MVFSEQRALQLGADAIVRRGQTIYERDLQQALDTPDNLGQFLSIDIDTGNYIVGGRKEPIRPLRDQNPDAVIFALKIGYPAAFTTAGRLSPLSREGIPPVSRP